jgi:hypothetical protein
MATAQAEPEHLDFARLLSIRVDQGLFDAIEQDAARLGVSLADCARMSLRTGSLPGELASKRRTK